MLDTKNFMQERFRNPILDYHINLQLSHLPASGVSLIIPNEFIDKSTGVINFMGFFNYLKQSDEIVLEYVKEDNKIDVNDVSLVKEEQ